MYLLSSVNTRYFLRRFTRVTLVVTHDVVICTFLMFCLKYLSVRLWVRIYIYITNEDARPTRKRCRTINCYSVIQISSVFHSSLCPCPWQTSLVLYCLSDACYTMWKSARHHFYGDESKSGTELRINRMEFLRDTRQRRYH